MRLGQDNSRLYIEFDPCRWAVGNLREEYNKRAQEIGGRVILGMSSGLDSQSAFLSFRDSGVDINTAFLYLPGYNDVEYANLKILESAWGFKSTVIDIDPMSCKDEIMSLSEDLDIPPFQILHRKFLSYLPDVDFLQGPDGPFVTFIKGLAHFYEGYNTYEMTRNRAFNSLGRAGSNILFDKTSEIIVSSLSDEIMQKFIADHVQYDLQNVSNVDWWDKFIKLQYYRKYWGDSLFYFDKFAGYENIDYIVHGPQHKFRQDYITVPVDRLLSDLTSQGARYFTK